MAALTPFGGQQQGESQTESVEGLTDTLNGDSITTEDTNTISASKMTDATTDSNDGTSIASAINVTAINQSTGEEVTYTEQAYVAMQNNDTQSVIRI